MLGRHCRRAGGPNQRRNADPSLPLAAAAARCGCRACPALFPFVDFGPSFTQALGLRSARALPDTTCSPLSTLPTPPSGAVRPPSGQCLADTTCLPLSTCPDPLKPRLHRVAPGRTGRKKRDGQFKATQTAVRPGHWRGALSGFSEEGADALPKQAEGAGLALPLPSRSDPPPFPLPDCGTVPPRSPEPPEVCHVQPHHP